MKKLAIAVSGAFLLTACVNVAPVAAPPAAVATKGVTVKGAVRVVEPGAFKLKAADQPRVPYELRRLDHIEVWLENTDLGGGMTQVGTLNHHGASDADHTFDPVVIDNLKPWAHYRVTLKAFQFDPAQGGVVQVDENAGGESETTFDTNLDPASGFTDGANESVTLANGFALKLRDQGFSGVASGNLDNGLAVDDGTLNDPVAGEVLRVPVDITSTFDLELNCEYGACSTLFLWYPSGINGGSTFHFTAQDPGTTSFDATWAGYGSPLVDGQAIHIAELPHTWTVTATGGTVSDPGYNYPGDIGQLTATSNGAGGVVWSWANHPSFTALLASVLTVKTTP